MVKQVYRSERFLIALAKGRQVFYKDEFGGFRTIWRLESKQAADDL